MSKQDRQGVRKAADLELKYSFGKVFSNQARLNESQEQEIDSQRLTLSQFVSYASTAIETMRNELNVVNKTLENIDDQFSDYWKTLYPIGHIYISLSETNPGTIFGGEWEQLEDMFLLGASSSYAAGSTGGEAEHTLTVGEMPSHRHGNVRPYSVVESGTGSTATSSDSRNSVYFTDYEGGNLAHNNMPPYLAVYMWKRIA